MRKNTLSLCLLVLAAGACKSTSGTDTPMPAESGSDVTEEVTTDETISAEQVGQEWDRLTLAEQKKVFLVERHLEKASELREELRLEQAERELALALELDPDNLQAKKMMAEVGALLGRAPGEIATITEQLEADYWLRIQQAREDARDNVRKAKVMLARGEYDGAIVELTLALDHIRWAPYSIDWEGLDQEATSLLESARSERVSQLEADRQASQQAALERLRKEEAAQREQQTFLLQNLLDQAITAFKMANYDEAMEYADRVLREDPRNEQARDIRDSAFRAGRQAVRKDTLARKLEQYTVWQEEMDELRVPYTEFVTLPDEDFWNEITELRARRRGIDLSMEEDPADMALRRQLKTLTIPGFSFQDEESLAAVVGGLGTITGLPLVVAGVAEEAAIDEGVVFNFNFVNPLSVEKTLNLITDMAGEDVTWTVRHEAVIVTTREKARGELLITNHIIDDLIFGLTDFLGPRIDRLRLIDDIEDDDGGGPFGGIGERPNIIEPDDLSALVQENVAVGTWEDEGVSIAVENGSMIVVHTAEVQKEVRQFLEDLRRFSSSLVTIESKFFTVADNFLQELGVEWRGLDNTGSPFTDLDDVTNGLEDMAGLGLDNLGPGVEEGGASGSPSSGIFFDDEGDGSYGAHIENLFGSPLGGALTNIGGLTAQWTFLDDVQLSLILRAVEKQENLELLNDQVLSVHNTQRAYVTVINQRAYIQDFDVEVAQFEAVADPVINVLEEGIVLDVRPIIHQNRKYITLEIQPTVADVVALVDFSTTLGGQTQAVTFQLPELRVQSVFTTVHIPDGGSIMIGGLSRIRNIERRAEVPWIAKIPLIGFFFKEEGYSDEKESLMIMLRAWITDVKAELARLERR
ncbi:MAG: hypothetical protein O7B99_09820 [Planctomycetota bacterium]|nr:hypothetical protein [Planctomycetota bacterium]